MAKNPQWHHCSWGF